MASAFACRLAQVQAEPLLGGSCSVLPCSLHRGERLATKRCRAFPSSSGRLPPLQRRPPQSGWILRARVSREATEDEMIEEEVEEDAGLGIGEILSLAGLGCPAVVLGGLWFLGQLPLTLVVSLAVLPVLQRAAGPLVSGFWGLISPPKRQRKPKPRRRRGNYQGRVYQDRTAEAQYSSPAGDAAPRQSEEEAFYWPEGPVDVPHVPDVPATPGQGAAGVVSSVGGWDQPEWKAAQPNATGPGPWSRSSSTALARPRAGHPLVVRMLVALFPFLRSWGGFQ